MTTPTATQLPPGVSRNTEPCWVLAYANGSRYESHDGDPHFGTQELAQGLADKLRDEDDDDPEVEVPKPIQLADPCYLVTALCGYVLDEGEWIAHSDTPHDAAEAARGYGWRVVGKGVACDCDECHDAAALYAREHPAPVPVGEDQPALIEVPS